MILFSTQVLLFCLLLNLSIVISKYVILTTSYPPFSDCTSFDSSLLVTGAEINLIRSAFTHLNWTEGQDYEFNCIDTSLSIAEELMRNESNYFAAAGGVTIAFQRIQQGFAFSLPTSSSGISLVYNQQPKGWFFRRSMDILTWSLIFLTIFIVGGITYYLEETSSDYINLLYNAFCQVFHVPEFQVRKYGSKLVLFYSLFLITIILTVFTAAATNIFTEDKTFGGITSPNDLTNRKIYTNSLYFNLIQQYRAKPIITDTNTDSSQLLPNNFSPEAEYLALDLPYAKFLTRRNCNLHIALNEIEPISFGIMFAKTVPKHKISHISFGLVQAIAEKTFEEYVAEYYAGIGSEIMCDNDHFEDQNQVLLYDTRGLWYIYFVGIGLAFAALIVTIILERVKQNMRVFDLRGVRARREKKLQRRIATVTAMYSAISLQSIFFLKKLNQKVLLKCLSALRTSLPDNVISQARLKAVSRKTEKTDDKETGLKVPENFPKRRSSVFKGIIDHVRRQTRKFSSFIVSKYEHSNRASFGRYSVRTDRIAMDNDLKPEDHPSLSQVFSPKSSTKAKFTRKSSLLNQSLKNYDMKKSLYKRLSIMASKNLQMDEASESIKTKKLNEIKSYLDNILPQDESAVPRGDEPKQLRRPSMMQRFFGKRGLKKDDQLERTAGQELERKQEILIKEFTKKLTDNDSHTTYQPLKSAKSYPSLAKSPLMSSPKSPGIPLHSKNLTKMDTSPVINLKTSNFSNLLAIQSNPSEGKSLSYKHMSSIYTPTNNRRGKTLLKTISKRTVFAQLNYQICFTIDPKDSDGDEFDARWQDEASLPESAPARRISESNFSQKIIFKESGKKGCIMDDIEDLSFGKISNESNIADAEEVVVVIDSPALKIARYENQRQGKVNRKKN